MKHQSESRRCAVYVRMARCEYPADIDAQVRDLTDLANAKGFEVADVFREVGSGISLDVENRPVLRRFLERAAAGCYDAVLVKDVSRLARGDSPVVGTVFETLRFSGVSIVTPDCEYDLRIRQDREEAAFLSTACITLSESVALRSLRGKRLARETRASEKLNKERYEL